MYKSSPHSKNYSMYSLSQDEYADIERMNFVDSIFTLPVDSNQNQVGVITSPKFKYRNIYFLGPLKVPLVNSVINREIIDIIPMYFSEKDNGKKILENFYFCIGDNFPESKDSRYDGLIS